MKEKLKIIRISCPSIREWDPRLYLNCGWKYEAMVGTLGAAKKKWMKCSSGPGVRSGFLEEVTWLPSSRWRVDHRDSKIARALTAKTYLLTTTALLADAQCRILCFGYRWFILCIIISRRKFRWAEQVCETSYL